ncbi:MAG TPA: sigma-70 family RNA polymerase sigma factor [Thermoanaerobaculia bacterium]|nr:sigma-70 family RNA polymerase sigma factor [Thermoanaerobaculia bacterium]
MPDPDDPNQRLVELIQAGIDPEGNFERLFKLHYRGIHYFFLRRGFSAEETRDLGQDVFLRVSRGLPRFRRESQFKTWIFEIADNVAQNELRRRSTGKRKGKEISLDTGGMVGQGEEGEPAPFEPPPQPPKALDEVLKREQAELLSRAIQDLPQKMRVCFQLRYGQGCKYEEIAVLMNVSIDTVKAHLYQAKQRLKIELSDAS